MPATGIFWHVLTPSGPESLVESETDGEELGTETKAVLEGGGDPEDLRILAAKYLLTAKRDDGMPRDPVARFHLSKGIEVHNVHADADSSTNGRAQSSGAMVNYICNLNQTERNHENFVMSSIIAASRTVQALSTATLLTKSKESTPRLTLFMTR